MTQLRQIDNKQLLQELQNHLHNKQLSKKEIAEWDRIQAEDVGKVLRPKGSL